MTPIKAIRAKCLDCMLFNKAEVRRCPSVKCPLYPFRMGHKPKVFTPEGAEGITTLPEMETLENP